MTIRRVAERLTLPGFVNAHCHSFQRALRGREEGADFWAWREAMLHEAERQTPETVRSEYAAVYREMRAAGYTAVGEFHYLGLDEARAAVEAAAEAEIELVLLLAAYARGGLPRFRQASVADYLRQVESLRDAGVRVGLAPHSVRACPPDWLEEIGRYAAAEALPLHVHADEQPREIDECLAEHGLRPIELLARTGCLGPGTTVVHATHANDAELDLLVEAGSRVCLCPDHGGESRRRLCAGRGAARPRGPHLHRLGLERPDRPARGAPRAGGDRPPSAGPPECLSRSEALLAFGSAEGAAALGLESWPDVSVDVEHRSLRGIERDDLLGALVLGCGAEVLSPRG